MARECSWLSVRRYTSGVTKGARCSGQLALHALRVVTWRTDTSCILEVAAPAITHALVIFEVQVVARFINGALGAAGTSIEETCASRTALCAINRDENVS